MAEYIDRDKVLDAILQLPPKMDEKGYGWLGRMGVWQMLSDFPSADVQPMKHGRWDVVEVEDVSTKSNLPITTIASMWCNRCNRFHNEIYYYGNPTEYANFCPNCGARMDGEDNG